MMKIERMKRYRAFGLTIGSDVELGELTLERDDARPVDVWIERGSVGHPIPPIGQPPHFDFSHACGPLMVWPAAAGVRIRALNHIVIEPAPDVPNSYLAFPLLGPAMGWLLHMRGLLVLHASAIAWHGKSVGLLGDKRAGKSTTAAAFLRAGARLLTDDLLAIDTAHHQLPTIFPAFPQVKLDANSADTIGIPDARILPLVAQGFDKLQHRLQRMHDTPIAANFIFVLERGGNEPTIEWLDASAALGNLIRFSYNVRFSEAPVEQQERSRHFQQCIAVVNGARIGRLTVPPYIGHLEEVTTFIERLILNDEP